MKNIDEKLNTAQSRKVIAIVGPTASGKTGIGVRLAKEYNGEIVSADSRQVYRGLDLGTGKDLHEYAGVRYHMIDIVEPGTKFNLFDYLPLARVAIEDIFSRGKMPIIVGGTGMYVQALTEGFQLEQSLVASHPTPPRLRVAGESIVEHSREQLNLMSKEQLNSILAEIDPGTYENIDINNPYRLIRAIERAQSGERAIKIKPDFEVLQIALDLPREELHSRIDKRVDERFEQGMLEEVVDLINKGVDPEWLVGLGLEYREITNFIINQNNNDEILKPPFAKATEVARQVQDDRQNIMENGLRTPAFAAMAQQLKYKIHQFVRRQLTWFRRFPEIRWAKDYDEVSKIVKEFLRN